MSGKTVINQPVEKSDEIISLYVKLNMERTQKLQNIGNKKASFPDVFAFVYAFVRFQEFFNFIFLI